MRSLVSVIIPTRNSAATLEDCLKSIALQTYSPIEIIVVDRDSSDSTPDIAHKYTNQVFNAGPERSAQRNYGVEAASGEYVAIIDSDMKLEPNVIQECIEQMTNEGVEGVVVPEESFGEGFWAQCKKLERGFYVGVPYMEAARFFSRETFQKAGGYDEDMVSGEDWDLSQRVEKLGRLGRIDAYIYHNEGRISLLKTIQKKYYYAQKFAAYARKNKNTKQASGQLSIWGRYWLFISRPARLFRNPLLGLGMLFMKTCEFGVGGIGFIVANLKYRVQSSK